MEFVLIRHGDPDYSGCVRGGVNGQGFGLVPLTELGRKQAQQTARHPALKGAELVIASPYTRALQTAAEIVRITGLPLMVEPDLHEVMSDRTGTPRTKAELDRFHRDFLACKGRWPAGEERCWETVDQLIARITGVLDRYTTGYRKVIVVTHGGVIRRFVPEQRIDYCKPYVVQVPGGGRVQCHGWVEVPRGN